MNHSVSLRGFVLASLCGAALFAPGLAQAAAQAVDLKLVLATDVSRSMDNEEFGIEREGAASAFADPEVVKAIQNGALGKIAVAVMDFSTPEFNKVVVDWHIVRDRASATALAEAIRDAPRSIGMRTAVSGALQFSSLMLIASEKDITSERKVIDVSGDGPNNAGDPMSDVHDKTIADGIIVNGLPVMDEDANGFYPRLDKYYAACVAGGRGSFVLVVHSYKDYGASMRRKLILEISQNETAIKQAQDETSAKAALVSRPVMKIADTARPPASEVLRPGPNEDFKGGKDCDYVQGMGGFGRGGFGGFGNPY